MTLFFAGEHTDTTGHWGTVHAAMRSGQGAAQQVHGHVRSERIIPRRRNADFKIRPRCPHCIHLARRHPRQSRRAKSCAVHASPPTMPSPSGARPPTPTSARSPRRSARASMRQRHAPTWSCASSTTPTSASHSATTAPSTNSPDRRAATSSPRTLSSRNSTICSPSAATSPASTAASIRICRSTTTRTTFFPRHPRALRRPHRVLRAHHRRVPLPRRPRKALLRRSRRALQGRRRALDHWRRLGDPHRGLSPPSLKIQIHRPRILRRAARLIVRDAGLRTTATMVIGFDQDHRRARSSI